MTGKLSITLIILLSFLVEARAQLAKKSILVGGQISYYNANVDFTGVPYPPQNLQTATYNISLGKALSENSFYGINFTFAPQKFINSYNGSIYTNVKSESYLAGLFNRRYKKLATDFYFFIEIGAAYTNYKETHKDTVGNVLQTITKSGGQMGLEPGISYRIWKKLYLEILIPDIFTMQYVVTKSQSNTSTYREKEFQVQTSLNAQGGGLSFLGVGFHFIL